MKKAIVMSGYTVLTKNGIAHAGAEITAFQLKGSTAEFNKLINLKKLRFVEKKKQTTVDDFISSEESGEEKDSGDEGQSGEEKDSGDEGQSGEESESGEEGN